MLLTILGAFVAIYTFSRKAIKNEPYKQHISNVITATNNSLIIYKDTKPKVVLEKLIPISNKMFFITIGICFLAFLFPKSIQKHLIDFLAPVLVISMCLKFSISWIQKHKKTVKELFFSFPMLFFLAAPLALFFLETYGALNINSNPFRIPFGDMNIIVIEFLWVILIVAIYYLGAFLIATPIYYILYASIWITGNVIWLIEKVVDKNIMDGVVAVIILSLALIKIVPMLY